MKKSQVPVLVVGAGAAGTMLTLELARRGVKVRTIDRLSKPVDTSRAIALHARTLEILERIDRRLVDRYLDRGIKNNGYLLHFVDAAGHRSEVRPGIDFTKLDSRYPYMLVQRQSEVEQYLREYTGAHYGVSPDWNTACVDVQQDSAGVIASLESGGVREEVRCQYLVGCDGASSRVRDALGFGQEQDAARPTVLRNLDAKLEGFSAAGDWVHCCAGADHFVELVALPGGIHRLSLSVSGQAATGDAAPEDAFEPFLAKHFDGVRLGNIVSHSTWQSAARVAPVYRQGRVFLAGDAAHTHSPIGDQSVDCSIEDAYNLGWKLAFVVKHYARPALLDTYEAERGALVEQVDRAAWSLHDILMERAENAAREPAFLEAVAARCSGLAYDYRGRAALAVTLAPMEGPEVGDRAPDADIGWRHTVYEYTRHPRCTLLVLLVDDAGRRRMEFQLKALTQRFKTVLELRVLDPSPQLERRYGASDRDRFFLVRPDGYIGFRCYAAELPQLELYLATWFAL